MTDDSTPDVAGRVMARLGYRATDRRSARRTMLFGVVRRVAGTLLVIAIFGSGLWWVDASRRESLRGTAFEDLMRSSMRENRDRISNVVDSFAPLSLPSTFVAPFNGPKEVETPRSPAPGLDDAPDGVRKVAIAPFRKA